MVLNRGRSKIFRSNCRIPVWPFVYLVKVWQQPGPKTVSGKGEIMPQYLVAIHHPDGYDGSLEGEAMMRDISALNEEMIAAGVRDFVGGLSSARSAKSLRAGPGGNV